MIQSPLALSAVIAAAAAAAFWLDRRFPPLGKMGASLMAIVFGAVLSNAGLVPVSSVVYDGILGVATSLAIAWLLLSVDLRDLKKAGGKTVAAFGVAVAGTVLGAFVAAAAYHSRFGDDTWRLAAALTGTYSGGSLNFASVGRAVDLSGTLFAGAVAADNLATGLWLAATLTLPVWLRRFFPPTRPPASPPASLPEDTTGSALPSADGGPGSGSGRSALESGTRPRRARRRLPPGSGSGRLAPESEGPHDGRAHHPYFVREGMSAVGTAGIFAAGLVLVWASEWLGGRTGVPAILWLTTLALLLGHSPWCRRAPGAMQLGSVSLHFFFVLIGILSRFSEIAAVGPAVLFFTLLVVGVHGVFVFAAGKLLRLDVGTLAVASQAAVGGPSSALAVAVSREWRHLVLPGVAVGLLGYAVGTYLGLAVGYAVRAW